MIAAEFETRSSDAPRSLVWGFVRLDALRAVPARARCEVENDDIASLTFIGAGGEPAANGSVVHIRMFRLPAADAAFVEELKAAASLTSASTLPGGRAFAESMLAPANVPVDWRHKAVLIESNGHSIVHAYRGKSRAMIVRYEQRRGDVIDDVLFVWVAKNLAVIDAAWLVDASHDRC